MEKIKIIGIKRPKNIIITAGPTNERLDAVMQITNMSTGALGANIANTFLENEDKNIEKIYYICPKLARVPNYSSKLKIIKAQTADDLLNELEYLLETERIDTMIHSAAVGDYEGKHAITAAMLAENIVNEILSNNVTINESNKADSIEFIREVIRNPKVIVDDTHKISSDEEDLIFNLKLTKKVIKKIKEISPDTDLIGFKLLDGVTKEELIEKATKLREATSARYIIANDLSNIGGGKHNAYFVGENGIEYTCENKDEIAKTLQKTIFRN